MMPKARTTASNNGSAAWKTGILPIAMIVVLAFAVYGHLWQSGYTPYSKHSDSVAQHLGMKWAAYRSIADGHGLPFWKDDIFAGTPALTNPQSLYANPFHLLFNLMEPTTAGGPTLWIHFLVMALGMYGWGWSMGFGVSGRFVMAVAGLVNFKLVIAAYAGWMAAVPALAVCPLLFAAVTCGVRWPSLLSTVAMGAAGVLFLVGGHPQFLCYAVLLAASYVLVNTVALGRHRQWQTLGRQMLCLAAGMILAVGITSPLLISFLSDRGLITRSGADYSFFLGEHHLQLRHLLTFLYPEWLGTPLDGSYPGAELWEDVAYFGVIPLGLALVGLVLGWSRPPVRWLAGAAVVCLLLAADTPVGHFLFDWLPGYALFRQPNRFLFFFAFVGIALAGIGIEELMRRWPSRRLTAILLVGATLLMVAEGAIYARRYVIMKPRGEVVPRTAYADFFAADTDLFRIATGGHWIINSGWAGPMNLQLITGYDSYNLRHYQTYFDLLQGVPERAAGAQVWVDFLALKRPDMLDVLNTKYIVSSKPLALPKRRYSLVAQFKNQPTFAIYTGQGCKDVFIYRNRSWLPRAFWAEKVVNVADEQEMIDQVRRNNVHGTAVVLDSGDPSVVSTRSPEDRATMKSWRAGDMTVSTSCAKRRYLVLSEVWHPGWRATVDGQPALIHRTDIALMGLWVDAGTHEVRLTFRPVYWSLGLTLSGLSGGILVALFGVAIWRGRKPKS